MISTFWQTPSKWPNDPPGYVFLARAFDEICVAMFGHKWSEQKKSEDSLTSEELDLDVNDGALDKSSDKIESTPQARRVSRDARAAFEWDAIKDEIVKHCLKGDLNSAVRKIQGGAMTLLGWEMWNGENLDWRFERCQMSLDYPFGMQFKKNSWIFDPTHWIFIERQSLNSLLAELTYGVSATEASRETKPGPSVHSAIPQGLHSKRIGRPPGAGSWAGSDAPLLAEMHELIKSGAAKSANDAARTAAGKAAGSGTPDSKITRLAKRYRKQYPS